MKKAAFTACPMVVGLFALSASAAQLTELPEGPNRNLVLTVCQSCHDLTMVLGAAGISRADWDSTLNEMTDNGMQVSAEEREKLLEYLSTYLGPSPPKPTSTP